MSNILEVDEQITMNDANDGSPSKVVGDDVIALIAKYSKFTFFILYPARTKDERATVTYARQ